MNGYGRPQDAPRDFLQRWILLLLSPLVILAFSGTGTCVAQDTPVVKLSPADSIAQRAVQKVESRQWDQAIVDANAALKIDAKNGMAMVARGRAYNGKGEYDKAIADFDVATDEEGRSERAILIRADAYTHRSFAYLKQNDYYEAVDSAYFATLEKSDHFPAHKFRVMAYLSHSQADKAIRSANRMMQIQPESAEGHSFRGAGYAVKKNWGQAIKDQTKALELDPQYAVALQRRGAVYLAQNDVEKAATDINAALQIDPNLAEALCNRAYLHGLKRDLSSAMVDLNKAIGLQPDLADAHLSKGRLLLAQGNFNDATKSLDKAILLNERSADAYCFRGYAFNGMEKYSKAEPDFTKAIELDPKNALAYAGRSAAYKKLSRGKEARIDTAMSNELTGKGPKKKDTKKTSDKKEDNGFHVVSKPVNPKGLSDRVRSAKKIDQMVAANYAKYKVAPNPKTTDAQFLRRIYLDITGTIPTYVQTRSFLGSKNPAKRSELIDSLLNSDGYASHKFNYWADVLRYTDNLNNNVRGEPYRQWIKQSLAENKPWDKMVHEMMIAEGLIWDNPATGYIQRDSNMQLDNMNNTVRIFLGTRIGCAQCHDHPFDRWTQKEFYQMAAFTFGTQTRTGGHDKRYWNANPDERLEEQYAEIEQEEEDRRRNSYRFKRLVDVNMTIVNDQTNRKLRLPKDYAYDNAKPSEVMAPKALFGKPAPLNSQKTPRHAFASWLTAKDNPRFTRTIANRLWKQAFGVGQIEPVDDMMDTTVAENPELMTFLESEMIRLKFDMKEFLRMVYNTETYQRRASSEEVLPGEPYHFAGPILRRMTAEQVWDSFLTLTVKPDFTELAASVRTDAIGVDLTKATAEEVMSAEVSGRQVDSARSQREKDYKYKGVLLARASELPSPVPANHFLRTFGQSNRELISASSDTGSVPQVLFMFNGPVTHMLLESNSTIYNNVMKKKKISDGVGVIFRTILNRDPDLAESQLARQEVESTGAAGYGNVIWSLVNTREFLFIQ